MVPEGASVIGMDSGSAGGVTPASGYGTWTICLDEPQANAVEEEETGEDCFLSTQVNAHHVRNVTCYLPRYVFVVYQTTAEYVRPGVVRDRFAVSRIDDCVHYIHE